MNQQHLKFVKEAAFGARQREQQAAYFSAEFPDAIGYRGSAYRVPPEQAAFNLAPSIRESARAYFERYGITWHLHANHALSSQICCLNFLMPLAERPQLLAPLVSRALGIPEPQMLEIESGPNGRPWFIGFEWIGGDYLNESAPTGKRRRGANCTSVDAVLKFRHQGTIETLLIEWKYTERYGQPLAPSGNDTRIRRYKDLAFHPNGPFRNDLRLTLNDFFYEPFYQLARQQMLAFQIEKAAEGSAKRVRVLHIAPAANLALKSMTSPPLRRYGDNAFAVFKSLLVQPDNFVSRSTEELFGPLLTEFGSTDDWAAYLAHRYTFLGDHAVRSVDRD